ncbi:hypothetical protein [Streptomyces finlayi]|uniref:hypothetical protein n=1 Tax=Streptomyces finlayi TaxID=67296 RepID=UPI00167AB50A|nr:hypothetical protein [Streptomyces finlayi]
MDPQQPGPAQPAPDDGDASVVCAQCGTRAQGPPPTWTLSVEGGSRRHFCVDCARTNLRAIEGRLDSSWW